MGVGWDSPLVGSEVPTEFSPRRAYLSVTMREVGVAEEVGSFGCEGRAPDQACPCRRKGQV